MTRTSHRLVLRSLVTVALALTVSTRVLGLAVAAQDAAQKPPLLLVLNKEDATLAFVDPATGTVTTKVPTGEGPHEVVASTDGMLAFVSNYGGNTTAGKTISVIDIVNRKELRRVDVTPLIRPHGLAYADGKLYFTAETNRIIARYDPAADKIDWMIGTGQTTTHMVMVNPTATRIITANIGGNSLAMFERGNPNSTNWNETVIPVGRGPEGFDLSPDGKEIWAAHSVMADGGVSVIDVATKKVVATLDTKTSRSNRLKFTLDGALVLISDYDAGEILVIDAATRKEVKHVSVGKNPEGILMAPDGLHAYVGVNGDNFVGVFDLKTLTVTSKILTGNGPDGMAWVGPGRRPSDR